VVREYSVNGDTVKFYSIDRSDWEEVPASLVDLKKTEVEVAVFHIQLEIGGGGFINKSRAGKQSE
jgi:hypothetical protein